MKKGVTLVELVVSVIILALIVAGLAHIFVASRRFITLARSRAQAMEYNVNFLDSLNIHIRQDQWDNTSNPLYPSATLKSGGSAKLDYINYSCEYNVTDLSTMAGNPKLRKVTMTVNWTEPYY